MEVSNFCQYKGCKLQMKSQAQSQSAQSLQEDHDGSSYNDGGLNHSEMPERSPPPQHASWPQEELWE